jgi:hypothetical protein
MTRLILTTDDSGAGALMQGGMADLVIPFGFRFAWGPLLPDAELAALLGPRSLPTASHWLDNFNWGRREEIRREGLGLIELCERCAAVELWIDPVPDAQLMLVQLLDYFRSHTTAVPGLTLFQSDVRIAGHPRGSLSKWKLPGVKIQNDHLDAASMAWQAYRQPTPRRWADLLDKNTSVLPQLRQTVLELLEELPMPATGLGATEMRMLELVGGGHASPFDVFPGHEKPNTRRVFDYWEVGLLLDGLARSPAPAVSGLDEGPFTEEMHKDRGRRTRYKESKLSLTTLGEAVLTRTEDFSRHNPIHRWWGGTELTNDNLWCWDAASRTLIAP